MGIPPRKLKTFVESRFLSSAFTMRSVIHAKRALIRLSEAHDIPGGGRQEPLAYFAQNPLPSASDWNVMVGGTVLLEIVLAVPFTSSFPLLIFLNEIFRISLSLKVISTPLSPFWFPRLRRSKP